MTWIRNSGGALLTGSGGLPTWITSQTLNTWAAIPASNNLDALNPDNDAGVNPNYPSAAPWRSVGSHAGMVTAWCGASFDDSAGVMWWVDTGGHNDQQANGVYKFDLNRSSPLYTRVYNPSGSVGYAATQWTGATWTTNFAEMPLDGRPRAHHTVNFPFFWPGQGPGLASEILISPSGGSEFGRSRPYITDPTTGIRSFLGANNANNAAGGYDAACYDSVRGVVWKMPTSTTAPFSYWGGPSSDSWTTAATSYYMTGPVSLCHSPTLDVILVGNGGNDTGTGLQTIVGGFGVLDPSTGTLYANGMTGTYPTFTGAPGTAPNGFATGLWPGTCQTRWSARLGAFLSWDMDAGSETQVMRITPPGSSLFTGTWTIDYLTVSGSNVVTPSAAVAAGTYGRFFVWDAAGICGVVNATSEAGYFFRYA